MKTLGEVKGRDSFKFAVMVVGKPRTWMPSRAWTRQSDPDHRPRRRHISCEQNTHSVSLSLLSHIIRKTKVVLVRLFHFLIELFVSKTFLVDVGRGSENIAHALVIGVLRFGCILADLKCSTGTPILRCIQSQLRTSIRLLLTDHSRQS